MTPTVQQLQQAAQNSFITICIAAVLILSVLILYHITGKKAHQQNMNDIQNRYRMPKK
jgi:hypothetical protein